jgi:hypothetical protein
MLVAKCVIENSPNGGWVWFAWLADEAHHYKPTAITTPKRCVRIGKWQPPRRTYTTVKGAVASIKRLARHIPAKVAGIDLVQIQWGEGIDHKPQRKYVERRPLR